MVEGEGLINQGTFNQAGFQMYRVHQVMSQINLCWLSLTGETEGVPNHLVLFNCLIACYLELRPSFDEKEIIQVDKMLEELEKLIGGSSIWTMQTNYSLSGPSNQRTLNLSFYNTIRNSLRAFQSLILEYAGKHGLLNPSKEDPRRSIAGN